MLSNCLRAIVSCNWTASSVSMFLVYSSEAATESASHIHDDNTYIAHFDSKMQEPFPKQQDCLLMELLDMEHDIVGDICGYSSTSSEGTLHTTGC